MKNKGRIARKIVMDLFEMKRKLSKASIEEKEWEREPNLVEGWDKDTGLPYKIVRHALGHLCGYVGVDENHPYYRKDYNELYEDDVSLDVHGGVTFTDHFPHNDFWWIGFDSAHYGDLCPSNLKFGFAFEHDTYKNVNFILKEIVKLSAQLENVQ